MVFAIYFQDFKELFLINRYFQSFIASMKDKFATATVEFYTKCTALEISHLPILKSETVKLLGRIPFFEQRPCKYLA